MGYILGYRAVDLEIFQPVITAVVCKRHIHHSVSLQIVTGYPSGFT